MGLAYTDRSQKHDVSFLSDELEAKEVLNLKPVDFFGMIPMELFQGFDHRDAGILDPALDSALALLVVFAFDEAAEIFLVIPVLSGSLGGHRPMLITYKFQFEIFEVVLKQVGWRFHWFCLVS